MSATCDSLKQSFLLILSLVLLLVLIAILAALAAARRIVPLSRLSSATEQVALETSAEWKPANAMKSLSGAFVQPHDPGPEASQPVGRAQQGTTAGAG
jgi:nitrogen fixation/metabolism regulation signal transduction histidine kinase